MFSYSILQLLKSDILELTRRVNLGRKIRWRQILSCSNIGNIMVFDHNYYKKFKTSVNIFLNQLKVTQLKWLCKRARIEF